MAVCWQDRCRYNKEAVLEYLGGRYGSNDFTCERLESKSEYPSFKVSAPMEFKDQIEKPESWPGGVIVRRFRFKRGTFLSERVLKPKIDN